MENVARQHIYLWYPSNKKLGKSQGGTGLLEKTEVPLTYDYLIVLRQMYSVLIIFV